MGVIGWQELILILLVFGIPVAVVISVVLIATKGKKDQD